VHTNTHKGMWLEKMGKMKRNFQVTEWDKRYTTEIGLSWIYNLYKFFS